MIKKLIERFKEKHKSKMYIEELLNTEYEIPPEIEEIAESFGNDNGYFNYRIIEREEHWTDVDNLDQVEYFYEIYEVYYNGLDEIIAWTQEPISLSFENNQDVKDMIGHIIEAANKKILKVKINKDKQEELIELNKYIRDIK